MNHRETRSSFVPIPAIWRGVLMALNSGTCRALSGGLCPHGGDPACAALSQHSPCLRRQSSFCGQMCCHCILQTHLMPVLPWVGGCSFSCAAGRADGHMRQSCWYSEQRGVV